MSETASDLSKERDTAAITAAVGELRGTLKLALGAILVFVLLAANTQANLKARPVWDDLYAWLVLKSFAESLPLTTDDTKNERRLGRSYYCGPTDPYHRKSEKASGPRYLECPYLGELIAMPRTMTGWYQRPFVVAPVYPSPRRLRVLLYRHTASSSFWGVDREKYPKLDITFNGGQRFELFEPVVIAFNEAHDVPIAGKEPLPFGDYVIARRSAPVDHYEVLRNHAPDHYLHGGLIRVDPDDELPARWDEAQALLGRQGISTERGTLNLRDPAVLAGLAKAYEQPSSVSFAGFDLPARPFLAAFSVLFMVIALGGSAAIRGLERANTPIASPWILTAARSGTRPGKALEGLIILFGVAATLTPLACFIAQARLGVWPSGFSGWAIGLVNFAAALISTLVLAWMQLVFARARRLIASAG